jgi:hypothetical protein
MSVNLQSFTGVAMLLDYTYTKFSTHLRHASLKPAGQKVISG